MRALSCLAALASASLVTACLVACGLDNSGLLGDGGTGGLPDGASGPGTADGGATGTGDSTSPPTGGDQSSPPGSCGATAGCYVIPTGWTLVAFAPNQSTPCPKGFATAAPTDLVEGPNTSSACACSACTTGTQPTCGAGAIKVFYDVHSAAGPNPCDLTGAPAQLGNAPPAGGCDTDLFKGSSDGFDLKFVGPGASGGLCTSAGQPTGNLSYGSQDRECTPDGAQAAGCTGDTCTPGLAAPYQACVVQSGAASCPAGTPFTQQHVVGTAVTLACAACGCNVTADCKVALFVDPNCKNGEFDVLADGQCHPGPASGSGTSFNSYKYAVTNVACTATGSSAATNVTLANERTICCVP